MGQVLGRPLHLSKRLVLMLVALAIALGGGLAIGSVVRARPTLVVVQRGPTYPAADPPQVTSASETTLKPCRGSDLPVVGQPERCQPVAIEFPESVQPKDGAPGVPIMSQGTAPPMRGRERLLIIGGAVALALGFGLVLHACARPT